MQSFKNYFLVLCLLALFCTLGCQSKKSSPLELVDIDLLRGDIALCGGGQFGEVSFSLSCSEAMQETFDLAISLLHSFEYVEAEKAFVKVIDADPDCSMAYWGVAMSKFQANWGPNRENFDMGIKVLEIAESLSKTTKEQEYLDAIGAYYNSDYDKTNHRSRSRKVEKKMEEIYKKYEDDTEAAIFYALTLYISADPRDKTYENQKIAGRILEEIFKDQPNHPGIAHYIIHNYDNPELAHLALSTARRYAQIAPASAHAQHMPSHIFTRLGLWQESIQSNINSASSGRCYAEQVNMEVHWHNEIHAIDYLVYAYLQSADNVKATEQHEYIQTMYQVLPKSDIVAYHFAAIPARMALENKQWDKAAKLEVHKSTLEWDLFLWQKSIIHFARILGASHIGDISLAENELTILQSLHQELVNKEDKYQADQVMIQIKASQAWIHYASGNKKEGLTLMQEAAEMEDDTEKHAVTPGEVLPANELWGDMLLAMNQPSEALVAYEKNLKRSPNRFNGIYGAAVAAKKLGDQKKAAKYFEELIKISEGVDSDRAELEEAKEFVGQKGS